MQTPFYVWLLVVLHPILDLGLSQTQDILAGVGGGLTAMYVQEVQTGGGLEQDLLIAGRIAEVAIGTLLDQSSGLGVVFLLADDLLHRTNLLYSEITNRIIHIIIQNARKIFGKTKTFLLGRLVDVEITGK